MKKFKKNIYHISRKLKILMCLQIILLTVSFMLILFFYWQNTKLQQNNTIYQLNNTLLLHMNSTMEKLNSATRFPVAHIVDRYHDPLLTYLCNPNHGGLTETDFYRIFFNRTSEVSVQFPEVESVLLFDTEGVLLDSKTIYNLYLPTHNYSFSTWYQNCLNYNGKIYILTDSEIDDLGVRKTSQNLYGARVIYDSTSIKPICISLIGIRATDIPVTFEATKKFSDQTFAIFDSSGKLFFGDSNISIDLNSLQHSQKKEYQFVRSENGKQYVYHISYSANANDSYSVIRTPKTPLIVAQIQSVLFVFVSEILIIFLNIIIFNGIIGSINRPLARLINMCNEIGKGNFSIRIPCSQNDELAYLTNSFNSMCSQVQELISEVYVKTLTKKNLELQMLRSQINPHFLYNTLENMRMTSYTQGYTELSEMCLLLSKVLRYGVTNQAELVSVKTELEHLQYYITLLNFCFPRLNTSIYVDEDIMNYHIIKLILQPLVENSVNHAGKETQHPMNIQIWGYAEQNDLLFIVSDDGVGIPHEQLENIRTSLDDENDTVHGIGLKNIHRRIRLYYGDNYGIVINSSPGRGTSVTVRIPNTLPIQEEQHD